MSRIINFSIGGEVRTKKNSQILSTRGPRPITIASKAYRAWNKSAQMYLMVFRTKCLVPLPLKMPVNCRALFYQTQDVADANNLYAALADALQEGRIIENDKQIRSWDGSRMFIDKQNPRCDVFLEEYTE
jgi:Holliday junction resolvase RusA-like endonuclease